MTTFHARVAAAADDPYGRTLVIKIFRIGGAVTAVVFYGDTRNLAIV